MKSNYPILSTSDYSIFRINESQRPIHPAQVKALVQSMQVRGFMPMYHITVKREGHYFVIVDGHHRLAAAKIARVPVYYQVIDSDMEDVVTPPPPLKWTARQVVDYWAKKGRPSYIALAKYADAGIPLGSAAALLSGFAGGVISQNQKGLRIGAFSVVTTEAIDKVLRCTSELHFFGKSIIGKPFIDAVSAFLLVKGFDVETLIRKVKASPARMMPCANREQMMHLLQDVYNYRVSLEDKIDLVFPALRQLEIRKKNAHKGARFNLEP